MAKRTITELLDDIDGKALGATGETVHFSLEGRAYEIDLSPDNAATLRDALAPYISAGRTVTATARRAERSSRGGRTGADLGAVRQWARDNGYDVSTRGRVPANILEAYANAH